MTNTETYLKNVALKHMPPNLQKVDLLRSGKQNILIQISRGAIVYIPRFFRYLSALFFSQKWKNKCVDKQKKTEREWKDSELKTKKSLKVGVRVAICSSG